MSAESLTRLRTSGSAPAAVWVIIGDCPERLRELPDCINVKATDKPDYMDWRAVFDLHVDVFDLTGDPMLFLRTVEALEGAKPKCIGVACDTGVLGLSLEHESSLWKIWRHLGNNL